GYSVFAVDFFGDMDLYPNVKDCLIVIKELGATYHNIKENYGHFLAEFTIDLLKTHPKIDYLIIGSGLDDNFKEREKILKEIELSNYSISNLNNNLESIRLARNILGLYEILKSNGYKVPITYSFNQIEKNILQLPFPFILKKTKSAGGINVNKIENENDLTFFINLNELNSANSSNWLIQEYLEGIPVSCTTISNGKECEIITINRQIVGEKFVNSPKEFMYCGNLVPAADLFKEDKRIIVEISKLLVAKLKLKGINGFDFVLKNHYPYLMEINPRIPGSISVSETVLNLNLLDLHVQSFNETGWQNVKKIIRSAKPEGYATKLIFFAPRDLNENQIEQINKICYVHDKTESSKKVYKNEPVCTVLYRANTFADSYFGALKIIDEIKKIIE
ncbi:MAG: ATP-grasp domain-containing protein, partial [Candidatus Hermodarchaeota archaeon]